MSAPQTARMSLRVWAGALDFLVVFFGSIGLELIVGGFEGLAYPSFDVFELKMSVAVYVLNVIVIAAYFIVLWGLPTGQTAGAYAMRLKVVGDKGEPLKFSRAAGRFGLAVVSGVILFMGFIMAFVRPDQMTLHDLIAHTVVVNSPRSLPT